ncbi:AT-rich interactive domain-containing protein 5B-like isoform X1 [Scyliorhinus canicula]|uniref:AT-rich interactive domain-containing protein 5B-like isoform X1 n=1 Tax=Scyliorhinus canicula TaxID=7830 RepID=UPI0018F66F2A|nr:AT-rich interactive domain-containing protein 5B-like isoform X1 [Scyliorhinus canicula]
MEPRKIEWIGSPCGSHGPYTFYRAFSLSEPGSSGKGKALTARLGHFFFVRCQPHEPECIAELQLLWEDRSHQQLLASTRLYFSPEDTPQGRSLHHGQDEVIAVSKRIIIRLQDLAKWVCTESSQWTTNTEEAKSSTIHLDSSVREENPKLNVRPPAHCCHTSNNVENESENSGFKDDRPRVKILSYPQYCRYRAIRKRIQKASADSVSEAQLLALGGVLLVNRNTKILYCRETFEHPTLGDNKSICDEFAPRVLTRTSAGRVVRTRLQITTQPRSLTLLHLQLTGATHLKGQFRKKKKLTSRKNDESPSQENRRPSQSDVKEEKNKVESESMAAGSAQANQPANSNDLLSAEQHFLKALHNFMCDRNTPIARIPHLGFKKIDLFIMFTVTQRLGGYEVVTARRLWKHIYDELGGNPGSTSAATCTRRHYERLILPYERYLKGEEHKPLPPVKPRKHTTSTSEDSEKDVKAKNEELNLNVKKLQESTPILQKEGHLASERCQEKSQRTITAPYAATQGNPQDKRTHTVNCKTHDDGAEITREYPRSKTLPFTGPGKAVTSEIETQRSSEQKVKNHKNRECSNAGKSQKSPLQPQDLSGGPSVKQSLHIGTGGSKSIFQSAMFQHLHSGRLNFQLPEGISPLDILKSRLGLTTSKDVSGPALHGTFKMEQSQSIKLDSNVYGKTLGENETQNVAGLGQEECDPQTAKNLGFGQMNGIRLVKGNRSPLPLLSHLGSAKHVADSREEQKANPRPIAFEGLIVNSRHGDSLSRLMKRGLAEEGLNLSKSMDSAYMYDHKGQLCEILPQNLSNKQSPLQIEPSMKYKEQSSPLNLSKSSRSSPGKRTADFVDEPVCLSQKSAPLHLLPESLQNICENRESHHKNEQPTKKLRLDSCCGTEVNDRRREPIHSDHSSGVESLSSSPLSFSSGVVSDDLPTDLSLPKYPKIQKPDYTSSSSESTQNMKTKLSSETTDKQPTDLSQLSSLPAASETITTTDKNQRSPVQSGPPGPTGTALILDGTKNCQVEFQKSSVNRAFPSSSMVSGKQSLPAHRLDESRKEVEEQSGKKSLISRLDKVSQEEKPERDQELNLSNHQALTSASQVDNKKGTQTSPYLLGGYHPELHNMAEKFGAHFQLVDLNKNSAKTGKSDAVMVPVLTPGLPVSPVMVPGSVQHRQLLASHSQQMYNHLLRTSMLPNLPYDEVVMRRLSSSPSTFSPSHLATVYPEKRM